MAKFPNMTGIIGVNRRMVARVRKMTLARREFHTQASASSPPQPKPQPRQHKVNNNTTMEGSREHHELYHGTVEVSEIAFLLSHLNPLIKLLRNHR